MKILLADDERMVRLGLISMLDELYPGRHVYSQATNGRQMVEAAQRLQPDVVFVDIRMPLMNGLDALAECKESCRDTQFFILSGYSDFEYARAALRLGAVEYLLKPVSLETLGKAVDKASERIIRRMEEENMRFANNAAVAISEEAGTDIRDDSVQLGLTLICIDSREKAGRSESGRVLAAALREELEEYVRKGLSYAIIHGGAGEIYLVTGGGDFIRPLIAPVCEKAGLQVTCLYAAGINMDGLHKWRQVLSRSARSRALYGFGKTITYNEDLGRRAFDLAPLTDEIFALREAFEHKKEMEYHNVLNRIAESPRCKTIFREAGRDASLAEFLKAAGIEARTGSFRDFIESLHGCVDNMYKTGRASPGEDEIEWVKGFIRENYMNDISIASIAARLQLSPNYLSKIFHERVGVKFIDYLTRARITNAKRILCENPRVTVKDVAGMVGYISTRHFTKTFYRIVGCLPSEYLARDGTGANGEDLG